MVRDPGGCVEVRFRVNSNSVFVARGTAAMQAGELREYRVDVE